MTGIFLLAFFIFSIGYGLGYAIFSKSKARIICAVFCGIAAIAVTVGVVFAGCALMTNGI